MNLRAPLARVRGLGSAREGTEHYIAQRFTAVALVPLYLWFVFSIVSMVGADYAAVVDWIKNPIVTVLLITMLIATFHHAQLGMRVIIEDYVDNDFYKVTLVTFTKFIAFLAAVATVVAVIRIAALPVVGG